ncbi:MAG: outer membrane beta-barrel protein [Saprospiraceae bacterium]
MKNFDEKIRDKLFGAEMPVASGVWDSIEKNLDRNKDKRPVIWIMMLMLLTGLPALYFSVYHEAGRHVDHSRIMSDMNQNTSDAFNSKSMSASLSAPEQTAKLALIESKSSKAVKSLSRKDKQALGFQIVSAASNRSSLFYDTEESLADDFSRSSLSQLSVLDDDINRIPGEYVYSFPDREDALFGTKTECPRFREQWPLLYSFTDVSISHPSQSLRTQNSESSELVGIRSQSESSLPSFGVRTGFGYDFYNGLFVQAGIAYNQINIKFLHRQEDIINNKTSIVIDTLFNSEGEILSITRDTSVVQEIGIKETRGTNTFRMIDIPVEIGYHYPLSNKFSLRASVGIAFNVRTVSSGYMLDANAESFRYDAGDSAYFKTRTGLSYLANLAVETQVSSNIYLNAGIRWRHYGTEFNASENPVDQSFTSLGLSAGIRYRL